MKNLVKIMITIIAVLMIATLVSCGEEEAKVDDFSSNENFTVEETETKTEVVTEKETVNITFKKSYNLVSREELLKHRDALIVDEYYRNLNSDMKKIVSEVAGSTDMILNSYTVSIRSNETSGYDISIRTINDYLNSELKIAQERCDYRRQEEIIKLIIAEQDYNFIANETVVSSETE